MARQDLNLGTNANDGTGDKLRFAMKKVNENFVELYARTGGDGTQNIELTGNVLSCVGNLTITTNNTGSINLQDITNANANLNVFTHLRVNTAEADTLNNLLVNGNAKIKGNTTLGDNPGQDRINLNSTITGPIIPTADALYDLGTSSLRFRDIYVGGTLRADNVLFSDVDITGGFINNTIIGNLIPAEASFTKLTVSGDSRLGNLLIRNNMIYAENTGGGIELRSNGGGTVDVPSILIVGTGTNTNEKLQVFGNVKVTENITVSNATISGSATVTNDVTAGGTVTAPQLISNIADGTAPLVVTSTTQVANLNVAFAGYADVSGATNTVTSASQPNITSVGILSSLNVTGTVAVTGDTVLTGNLYVSGAISGEKVIINYIIDGSGETITTGSKKYLGPIPFNGTITSATVIADQVGSIEIEVRKCSYDNFDAGATRPSSSDIISGATPLTLTSAVKSKDGELVDWETDLLADDIFEFVVNSVTDITWAEIIIAVTKG